MIDLEQHFSQRIDELLDRFSGEFNAQMARNVLQAAIHIEGEIQEVVNDMFPDGKGGLQRSYNAVPVEVNGDEYTSGVFSRLSYARIQDEGGTIKPKHVQNLAIPLTPEAKVPGKWPRTWPKGKLEFIRTKAGRKFLIESKKNRTILHYALKRSVTIPGKRYLDEAEKRAAPGVAKIFVQQIRSAMGRV